MTNPNGATARPRRRRRGLRAVAALTGVLVLVVVAGLGYGYWKWRQIPRIHLDSDVVGVVPELTASTIAYGGGDSEPAAAITIPGPTLPAAATLPETSSTTLAGDTPTTDAAAPTTLPPGEVPVEEAIAAANQEDADAIAGKTTTTGVAMGTVPPGPILQLDDVAAFGGSGTRNFLMVGVDSRADVPKEQQSGFGTTAQVKGSRTDTIIVLRIDADAKKAWMLSLPRDLWLPNAATGRYDRINAAFAAGGATALAKTIQDRLAIPVHHVVQVNFAGFQKIVDTVGGVEICFANPTRDTMSGLREREAGCQLLDGRAATAYVRSRHYQELRNGKWVEDPRSDLGRIVRQQDFIRKVISATLSKGTDPMALNAMLDSMRTAIAIDSTFTLPETARLAADLRSFDPNTMDSYTIPVKAKRVDGKAVLLVDTAKAKSLLAKFRGD